MDQDLAMGPNHLTLKKGGKKSRENNKPKTNDSPKTNNISDPLEAMDNVKKRQIYDENLIAQGRSQ